MKTILIMLALTACGDDAVGIQPDAATDGIVVDGSVDGNMRDPDAMPPATANVPGGTFYRSFDNVSYTDNGYPATISSFDLDTYEVTVARFRVFVAATSLPTAPLKCGAQQSWTDSAGANESLPINCITWTEASAFCAWDLGRLPTEAEWNYAAAGGSEQRVYPWSSPATDQTLDSFHASYGSALSPVGSKPAGDGRWGQADLAGNVAEWTADWFAEPYTNPCLDCTNTTPTTARSHRGGGIGAAATSLPVSARRAAAPGYRSVAIGVRCARTP